MRWETNETSPITDWSENSIVLIDQLGRFYFNVKVTNSGHKLLIGEQDWNIIKEKIIYWQYMSIFESDWMDKCIHQWLEISKDIQIAKNNRKLFEKEERELPASLRGNLYIKKNNQWYLVETNLTTREAYRLKIKEEIHIGDSIFETHDEFLFNDIKNCIIKYYSVLSIKWKQTHFIDDYGKEITKDWDKELHYFLTHVVVYDCEKFGSTINNIFDEKSLYYNEKVKQKFLDAINSIYSQIAKEMDKNNISVEPSVIKTGVDYENYIESLLQKGGFNVSRTPTTGDQGVDLVATKNGNRIAVQCKYYSKPVGNKAVQEVIAGKEYYNCQHACVVSNNSFTPSARKIANISNILLLSELNIVKALTEIID